jgi:guanine nucleotide-binding protein subunit alpha
MLSRSYLKKLDEIVSNRYEPNNVDILLARLRTTAVSETQFEHAGVKFNIIDVGGQKGERCAVPQILSCTPCTH